MFYTIIIKNHKVSTPFYKQYIFLFVIDKLIRNTYRLCVLHSPLAVRSFAPLSLFLLAVIADPSFRVVIVLLAYRAFLHLFSPPGHSDLMNRSEKVSPQTLHWSCRCGMYALPHFGHSLSLTGHSFLLFMTYREYEEYINILNKAGQAVSRRSPACAPQAGNPLPSNPTISP